MNDTQVLKQLESELEEKYDIMIKVGQDHRLAMASLDDDIYYLKAKIKHEKKRLEMMEK